MTPPSPGAVRAERRSAVPTYQPAPKRRSVPNPRRPVPAPQRPRHIHVVRGSSVPGRRPPHPVAILVAMGTGIALFALVMANILLGQIGIVRAELDQKVTQQQHVVDALRIEVAQLSSPGRIAARAQQLGLVQAGDTHPIAAPSTVRGPSPARGRP